MYVFRKLYTTILISAVATTLLAACGNNTSQPTPAGTAQASITAQATTTGGPLTKVTIALGYIPDIQFAPFYLALSKGYYRDEGLDVSFDNGLAQDLMTELGTGANNINFAVVSGDELIQARVQGIPVKYVMTWYRQYPVAAVSITTDGTVLRSLADLKGKIVGAPQPSGATYIGLEVLLKAGGLAMSDIQYKSVGFTQVAALSQKQVQVAMVYSANEPTQLRSQGYSVSTLQVSDYMQLASNGLATNDKTLQSNPDLVQRVVRATLKGIQATIDHPAAAFQAALPQIPELAGDPAKQALQQQVLTETVKLMQPKAGDPAASQPLGWADQAVWTQTQDALLQFKVIPQPANINDMFTNQFVGK